MPHDPVSTLLQKVLPFEALFDREYHFRRFLKDDLIEHFAVVKICFGASQYEYGERLEDVGKGEGVGPFWAR